MFNFDADFMKYNNFCLVKLWKIIYNVFNSYLLSIGIVRYNRLRGASFLPTPRELKNRLALVNINNHDQKCFLWSILASIYPQRDNPSRVTKYIPYENTLNMVRIEYPVKLQQISKFEQQNADVSVNVFGYKENKVFPTRITESKERRHHANLLIINNNDTHHYILIKDLSHLLSLQYKSYNRILYFCPYCLHGCSSQSILDNHQEKFKVYGAQKVILPKKNGKSDKVYCYYNLLNAWLKNKFSITVTLT